MKQGGVLSPRIFTMYVDDIIVRLRNRGIGCHLLSTFLACIMYADDLCLIAPTRGAMQQMLEICEEFCLEFCLSFNAKKSKALTFGSGKIPSISPLVLNGESIDFVTKWKYLGCTVTSVPKFGFSNDSELNAFYCATNSILRSLKKPNDLVLMKLLYSNCVPNLTYCAEVKELTTSDMHKSNVALNDAIRRIFSYNRWESTRHLRQQLRLPNIVEIFCSRKKYFTERNCQHSNAVIRYLTLLFI